MKGLFFCLFFLLTLTTFSNPVFGIPEPDPTCECSIPGCCTLTRGYWCNHNAFENEPRNIAWPTGECLENNGTFSEHNNIFPGHTWLDTVCGPAFGDACFIAGPQYIAARLNKCNGACIDIEVDSELVTASFILSGSCPGLTPGSPDQEIRSQLLNISAILDSYNNGFLGPGHCGDEPPDCPEFDCEGGCTLTMGYWKNHNQYARRPRNLPWPLGCRNNDTTIPTETNFLFGLTWLEVLELQPKGDMCVIAGHQLITSWLNLCNGACVPEELVAEALSQLPLILDEWCTTLHSLPPPGPDATEAFLAARRTAQRLSEILDAYNNGILLGPGHCETIVESAEKGKTSKKADAVFENLSEVQHRRLNAVLILASITLGIVGLGALCWCGSFLMMESGKSNGGRGYKSY